MKLSFRNSFALTEATDQEKRANNYNANEYIKALNDTLQKSCTDPGKSRLGIKTDYKTFTDIIDKDNRLLSLSFQYDKNKNNFKVLFAPCTIIAPEPLFKENLTLEQLTKNAEAIYSIVQTRIPAFSNISESLLVEADLKSFLTDTKNKLQQQINGIAAKKQEKENAKFDKKLSEKESRELLDDFIKELSGFFAKDKWDVETNQDGATIWINVVSPYVFKISYKMMPTQDDVEKAFYNIKITDALGKTKEAKTIEEAFVTIAQALKVDLDIADIYNLRDSISKKEKDKNTTDNAKNKSEDESSTDKTTKKSQKNAKNKSATDNSSDREAENTKTKKHLNLQTRTTREKQAGEDSSVPINNNYEKYITSNIRDIMHGVVKNESLTLLESYNVNDLWKAWQECDKDPATSAENKQNIIKCWLLENAGIDYDTKFEAKDMGAAYIQKYFIEKNTAENPFATNTAYYKALSGMANKTNLLTNKYITLLANLYENGYLAKLLSFVDGSNKYLTNTINGSKGYTNWKDSYTLLTNQSLHLAEFISSNGVWNIALKGIDESTALKRLAENDTFCNTLGMNSKKMLYSDLQTVNIKMYIDEANSCYRTPDQILANRQLANNLIQGNRPDKQSWSDDYSDNSKTSDSASLVKSLMKTFNMSDKDIRDPSNISNDEFIDLTKRTITKANKSQKDFLLKTLVKMTSSDSE